jgi:hypothetical protein
MVQVCQWFYAVIASVNVCCFKLFHVNLVMFCEICEVCFSLAHSRTESMSQDQGVQCVFTFIEFPHLLGFTRYFPSFCLIILSVSKESARSYHCYDFGSLFERCIRTEFVVEDASLLPDFQLAVNLKPYQLQVRLVGF